MRKNKKLICALCVISISFTGCVTEYHSSTRDNQTVGNQEDSHPEVAFEDMEYQHLDTMEFYNQIDTIHEKMTDSGNAETVLECFDQMTEFLKELSQMYSLSSLYHSIDMTDESDMEEYSYCYNTLNQVTTDYSSTAQEILASECGHEAARQWNRNDVIYYRNYTPDTPEQLELQKKERKILLDYQTASVDTAQYSIEMDGKSVRYQDLYNSYQKGSITEDEFYDAYDELTEQENKILGNYYVQLIQIRQQIASAYGYGSYADYCYEKLYAREYSTSEIQNFYRQVKLHIRPLCEALEAYNDTEQTKELDEKVQNMTPEEQLQLMGNYLGQIDDSLTDSFEYMKRNHLYHLDYDEKKFNGGYTVLISGYQEPFLLNQPEFSFYDLTSLIHEFGHFNSYYLHYMNGNDYSNLDLAEIASQGLELLYTNFYNDMLGEQYGTTITDSLIYQILHSLISGCLFDEFQQKVYQLENPTLEGINELYEKLAREYGEITSEDINTAAYDWTYVVHNFEYPFYYISYAVSAAPSIELWQLAQTDFDQACDIYLDLVDSGEAGSYTKTLEQCGLTSPFSRNYFRNLSDKIHNYYNEIRGIELNTAK